LDAEVKDNLNESKIQLNKSYLLDNNDVRRQRLVSTGRIPNVNDKIDIAMSNIRKSNFVDENIELYIDVSESIKYIQNNGA
jgi:restriction endonuclease Mrr